MEPSNENGGQYFMSLDTGKKVHSYRCVELPMNQDVIDRVQELAEVEEQPDIKENELKFLHKNIL